MKDPATVSSLKNTENALLLQTASIDVPTVRPLLSNMSCFKTSPKSMFHKHIQSSFFALRCAGSEKTFNVHEELLRSEGGVIASAIDGGFQEGINSCYTFQETTEGTLARFIEWLYRGQYSDFITSSSPPTNVTERDTYALIANTQVYIFADTYQIPTLKTLARFRVIMKLNYVGEPSDANERRAIIQVLELAFSNLSTSDELAQWLGKYSAWCLREIRDQPQFHKIMDKISHYILPYVLPATERPTNAEFPLLDLMAQKAQARLSPGAIGAKRRRPCKY